MGKRELNLEIIIILLPTVLYIVVFLIHILSFLSFISVELYCEYEDYVLQEEKDYDKWLDSESLPIRPEIFYSNNPSSASGFTKISTGPEAVTGEVSQNTPGVPQNNDKFIKIEEIPDKLRRSVAPLIEEAIQNGSDSVDRVQYIKGIIKSKHCTADYLSAAPIGLSDRFLIDLVTQETLKVQGYDYISQELIEDIQTKFESRPGVSFHKWKK